MKTITRAILPIICATVISLGATALAQDAATNDTTEFSPGGGLRLDFRDVQLDDVLSYLSRAAGFVVYVRPGVYVDGYVNVRSEQPLTRDEAVELLKTVLSDHGCSVIEDGRTLTIVNTADIRTETTIKLGNNPALIPRNAEVVTQIIPVRNLNPVELSKILGPLLPSGAIVGVDGSANALLLTDTQADIHRAAEIIAALDSLSVTANTLRVFPLQYADATALADLIKQLFSQPDSSRGTANNNGAGAFIRFPGGPRGAGAAPAISANPDAGQTPVSRVAAVADAHGNAVIVSAPEALLPAIAQLVAAVDMPVEDITTIQGFALTNADPVELANELADLFPNDTDSGDSGGARIQFGGQGGRGGQAVGARPGPVDNASSGPSGRMQKLGRVLAVPDPRTSSLLVTAAKSLMPEIAAVVTQLDAREGGRQKIHSMSLGYADGPDVLRILQAVYPSGNTSLASTSQTDPLNLRSSAMWNNQFSAGSGSGIASGLPGGSAGGRGGSVP